MNALKVNCNDYDDGMRVVTWKKNVIKNSFDK